MLGKVVLKKKSVICWESVRDIFWYNKGRYGSFNDFFKFFVLELSFLAQYKTFSGQIKKNTGQNFQYGRQNQDGRHKK